MASSLLSIINISRRRRHNHHNHRRLIPLLRRYSSPASSDTTTASPLEVPLTHPTYLIWSANTSLGKTLVSTGLAFSSLLRNTCDPSKFIYLKPVQTGFPSDSDSAFVFTKLSSLCRLHKPHFPVLSSHHVLKSSLSAAAASRSSSAYGAIPTELLQNRDNGMVNLGLYEERKDLGVEVNQDKCPSKLVCKTIFAYNEAVSPHLAAEREGGIVDDAMVVRMLERCLRLESESQQKEKHVFCVVETAGGIASPGPSGSLQCDLYRQFRLPAVLVGDGRLGGISGTITAYESLMLRGYDVVAIVFEDHGLLNEVPLRSYLRNRVPVLVLPKVPEDLSNNLMEWFDCSGDVFDSLRDIMQTSYEERVHKLLEMPKKARDKFWWPFTQHSLVPKEGVAVIDSRCGENFAVFKDSTTKSVTEMFDACASWWTQGPDATLQTELARDMGYAAARFGHVMFPENVHQPALESAELLLDGVGKGWASRVYFSDNGSTAIEIAIKMGFRRFSIDHGIVTECSSDGSKEKTVELMVLALKGSYHGDTLGAMEAQAPSAYTGFLQQPWYTGRGLFLDPPTAFIHDRTWSLEVPELLLSGMAATRKKTFKSREELFCMSRDKSELGGLYSSYISHHLSESRGSKYIASLIIEPVIQGAGGMHMVDPLFQRILVNECRSRKIPVIFDEVFTGFWRLGAESAAELLGCEPDIACYAKLLTGGVIPLAVTLASSAIFDAFIGESKLDALLHGHSYSAHPMGCTAAAKSIKWFKDPQTNHNLAPHGKRLKELWDVELVNQISSHPAVKRVVALGTLFAMELQVDSKNAGYSSEYGRGLLQMLRKEGIYMRPLGNVIYLMCGPCTSSQVCTQLLVKLYRNLEEFHLNNNNNRNSNI